MNRKKWIYFGRVKQHVVEIVHFVKTGRFMVRMNNLLLVEEMLPVDVQQKTFDFFIDDEFCQVMLNRRGNQFEYEFKAHEYSTSKSAQTQRYKERLKTAVIGGGIALFLLLVIAPLSYNLYNRTAKARDLLLGGLTAPAKVEFIEPHLCHGQQSAFHRTARL